MAEIKSQVDNARKNTMDSLRLASTNVIAPLNQAPTSGGQTSRKTINDTLKPAILSLDNSPIEWRQRVEKLKSFFSTNAIDQSQLHEQQMYVKCQTILGLRSRG